MNTLHYNSRTTRQQFIEYNIGYGEIIYDCLVDNGHKKGVEIHLITSTGIIMIYNQHTGNHVTDLIARPSQLQRYGHKIPKETIALAEFHKSVNWNMI